MGEKQGTAIIIGAGPAGLTAALELIRHSNIKPILLESDTEVGGLSRTVKYNGNRMDIGGHRFFSKSGRVMQWWLDLLPLETGAGSPGLLCYQGRQQAIPAASSSLDPLHHDRVMLLRNRKSRIYFRRRFFDYPIRLSASTFISLGLLRTLRCGLSYLRSAILPQRRERSLEDFLINRFGTQLYRMFYKSYTEKVWGVPCREISAEWGAQRIKGLSLKRVLAHSFRRLFVQPNHGDVAQNQIETSLIEKFLYPKLGPGQLWEHVADLIRAAGGEIHSRMTVDRVHTQDHRCNAVEAVDAEGRRSLWYGDYFFSTMPVRDLIRGMADEVPGAVSQVSEGLRYRDFIVVGLLARRLSVTEKDGSALKDNWIYIQEPDVKAGRLQIFNNWSPWLVSRPDRVWIGLEYFCNESDEIWKLSDSELAKLAAKEAAQIGILDARDIEDAHVVRVPKSYPAYFGSYSRFHEVREFTDSFTNLFLIGRNGMHKYNNQDHSMLTAMAAVENVLNGVTTKENIWAINTEMDYQEEVRRVAPARSGPKESAAREVAVAGTSIE
ncbi:MAG TPA: NAD(P)/FAD-dependent oxidoreductase [Terracidiphilus sp.]|jgi:protoporphyrinogen oxidase|nr:NAD(P)/FAD-dependent oxidoreductase [Terracidiphilus sp.]